MMVAESLRFEPGIQETHRPKPPAVLIANPMQFSINTFSGKSQFLYYYWLTKVQDGISSLKTSIWFHAGYFLMKAITASITSMSYGLIQNNKNATLLILLHEPALWLPDDRMKRNISSQIIYVVSLYLLRSGGWDAYW